MTTGTDNNAEDGLGFHHNAHLSAAERAAHRMSFRSCLDLALSRLLQDGMYLPRPPYHKAEV